RFVAGEFRVDNLCQARHGSEQDVLHARRPSGASGERPDAHPGADGLSVLRFFLPFIAGAAALASACVVGGAPPNLTGVFPPSVGRGQSIVAEANGEFAEWPPQVWISRGGLTAVPDSDKGKLQITAAPDAPPGIAWLRLYN